MSNVLKAPRPPFGGRAGVKLNARIELEGVLIVLPEAAVYRARERLFARFVRSSERPSISNFFVILRSWRIRSRGCATS